MSGGFQNTTMSQSCDTAEWKSITVLPHDSIPDWNLKCKILKEKNEEDDQWGFMYIKTNKESLVAEEEGKKFQKRNDEEEDKFWESLLQKMSNSEKPFPSECEL